MQPNKSNYELKELTVPSWFCPVVCAGLDLADLMPTKPFNNKINMPAAKKFRFAEAHHKIQHKQKQQAKPKGKANVMQVNNFEENEMINEDRDMFTDFQEDPYDYDLSVPNPCAGLLPDGELCLKEGKEISNWFTQRHLNPGNLCNYASGKCDNLFD